MDAQDAVNDEGVPCGGKSWLQPFALERVPHMLPTVSKKPFVQLTYDGLTENDNFAYDLEKPEAEGFPVWRGFVYEHERFVEIGNDGGEGFSIPVPWPTERGSNRQG
jgi:hypothetical protein